MIVYILLSVALAIWSYSQVDLNLTISTWQPYLSFQQYMTDIGYYQRELNMYLFLGLLSVMTMLYVWTIFRAVYNKISYRVLLVGIIFVASVLSVSYTAFSHDLFNYMFDARIITVYNQNPYEHKALDYPQDTWIRFMQWRHRTYPYGPVWLGITAIPSYLGGGKFLPTYLLFKIMFALVYIGCSVMIEKIAQKLGENKRLAVALFAFHPLILIDGLISPRIDMVMLFFTLVGLYLLLQQKNILAFMSIILSAGIKFATILCIPFVFARNKLSEKQQILGIWVAVGIGVIAQNVYAGHMQPWYWIMYLGITPITYKFFGIKKTVLLQSIPMVLIYIYVFFINTGTWPAGI